MPLAVRDVVDGALLVEFPGFPDAQANSEAAAIAQKLVERKMAGVHDAVPGARTLLVLFDPDAANRDEVEEALMAPTTIRGASGRTFRIPVCYGGARGPDLDALARGLRASASELARLHASSSYLVAFIGFSPGFPYLTGLPDALHSPRLSSPRPQVPAGSVGIGGEYTGIYPSRTPGGWKLIGNAPIRLFNSSATPPALLSAGDRVRFEPIGEEDFAKLERQLAEGQSDAPRPSGLPLLRILSAGLCTSVQGGPVHGLAASGVPSGGAMDLAALRRANRALKNPWDAPALEITLQGPDLEFLQAARICISGSEVDAAVNGRPLSIEEVIDLRAGDRLTLKSVSTGARSYVCVYGGFLDAAPRGEPLRRLGRGDELHLAELVSNAGSEDRELPERRARIGAHATLRVVLGPQADRFSRVGRAAFLRSEYRVSPQSDRRGVRLEGAPIELCAPADIPPEGTAPGAIQVPANGLPIILGPDRPVTGGYAKIATVIGADLRALAQLRPGSLVRFQAVRLEEALAARHA
jgi:KipI family sensor histidine kinase inhibitor